MLMNAILSIVRELIRLPGRGLILGVRFYQICISPMLGATCRFQPTCSSYFIQSVEKYGAIRGTFRGLIRICKCHPFHPGGPDPP
jgi:putative membrane protein insertion efficiency factor